MSAKDFMSAINAGNTDSAITAAKGVIDLVVKEEKADIQKSILTNYGFNSAEKTPDDKTD